MAIKSVLLYPQDEKKLRTRSQKVKKVNAEAQTLIQDLKDTLLTKPGAGLAAPQIGVHKRIAVVRFGQDEGEMQAPLALVNPVILETGPLTKGFDGCLSLPRISTWDTLRPAWLRFRAHDESGKPFEMKVEGIDAALVHHEIDHLDGIFFLDRLSDSAKLYISITTEEGEKLVLLDDLPSL
ncbi:MAG: peptide deformylase [Chloroflexota bacterium]